jgi:hypothetical protein
MKTFVQMGDRLDKELGSGFRPGAHVPYGPPDRNGLVSGRCLFKRWFVLVSCGVLLSFLATLVPAREGNAAPREFDYLSKETAEGIQRDLGIKPLYIFAVNQGGGITIGVPPGSAIESFEDQFELWSKMGKITMKKVQSLEILRFRRNPIEQCFPYPAFGSIRWYCITAEVD